MTNARFGLLDSLLPSPPANDFLERLDRSMDWRPLEAALRVMDRATTGRPPCPSLALFKRSLRQHCYGLSDPLCEEWGSDRLSWRRFVGLGLQDKGPDETTRVRFRARMVEPGRHEKRLARVNRPLEKQGRLLKTCTLGDATWLPAARRAPGKQDKNGGAGEAGDTVKGGVPHSGDKAQVAGDQKHTLIRPTPLTAAPVQDRREFEAVVRGDEERVVADKAYWSQARSQWGGERGRANGILRKPSRGEKLRAPTVRVHRLLSAMRCGIEKVFGWWKRCAGYRRVRSVGREPNRLELEFKCVCWNLKRLTSVNSA